MAKHSAVQEFLDAYRTGFEAFDVAAIVDLFSYPCQITGGDEEVTVTAVPSRDAWIPQIERLVAAYQAIDVRSAEVLELQVEELTARLAQATVHWGLEDGDGRRLYDFDATYTLADLGQGWRITAVAHNETSRLRALIERARPS